MGLKEGEKEKKIKEIEKGGERGDANQWRITPTSAALILDCRFPAFPFRDPSRSVGTIEFNFPYGAVADGDALRDSLSLAINVHFVVFSVGLTIDCLWNFGRKGRTFGFAAGHR